MLSTEDREQLRALLDHVCAIPAPRPDPSSSPAHRKCCDACLVEMVCQLSPAMATWPQHVLLAETSLWRQDRGLPRVGGVLCARYHEHD
jgi:hypothetical protein